MAHFVVGRVPKTSSFASLSNDLFFSGSIVVVPGLGLIVLSYVNLQQFFLESGFILFHLNISCQCIHHGPPGAWHGVTPRTWSTGSGSIKNTYQTTICYIYRGTLLAYHPSWTTYGGGAGFLLVHLEHIELIKTKICIAINSSLFITYPPSCPSSSSSSFFTNVAIILVIMSSRTLVMALHLDPSRSKGVRELKNTSKMLPKKLNIIISFVQSAYVSTCILELFLTTVLICFNHCFIRVFSTFSPDLFPHLHRFRFHRSTVDADGCCLALRCQLCASGHARSKNLCQSRGLNTPRGPWLNPTYTPKV